MTQLELDFGEEFARPQKVPSYQDKIMKLATEAGMIADGDMWFSPSYENCDVHINELVKFAKRVAEYEASKVASQIIGAAVVAEREACAERASVALLGTLQSTSDRVLKAIRTGGQQ